MAQTKHPSLEQQPGWRATPLTNRNGPSGQKRVSYRGGMIEMGDGGGCRNILIYVHAANAHTDEPS